MDAMEQYRRSAAEKARTADLLRLLPDGRHSVLDVGARDGYFSRLLTEHFSHVTALDLVEPTFRIDRVDTVAGDVTHLDFPSGYFDVVFCAEVLEHIPDLQSACREMARVARHEVLIGVPYRQDTRLGRTTCSGCGQRNPPWGHVNRFDEHTLSDLFTELQPSSTSFVWSTHDATNSLSTFLMDLAGNPWGTYEQDEPCIRCGAKLISPQRRTFPSRICSGIAVYINNAQSRVTRPHANWLHMLFSKEPRSGAKLAATAA